MKRIAPKLLAFVVAVFLWAAVNLERRGMETVDARVRFRNVPEAMEINPDLTGAISVVVRGPSSRVETARRDGLVLEIDCARMAGAGQRTISVDAQTLSLPRELEFVKAVPSQVRVALEETARRQVEIAPRFAGDTEPGYHLEGYWVEPERLTVVGPRGRVQLIEAVATDPINLSGLVGAHSFQTTAYLGDPYLRFEGSPTVTVDIQMQKR